MATGWKKGETPHDYRIRFEQPELDLMHEYKVKKILEVCAGDAKNLIALASKGYEVTGLENEPAFIIQAKKTIGNAPVMLIEHPIYDKKFPFKNNTFDFVYSYQYLNHNFKDQIEPVFKEIHRVLKKGGLFSIKITDIEQFNARHVNGPFYEERDPEFGTLTYRKLAPQTFVKLNGEEKWIPHYGFYQKEFVACVRKAGFKLISVRKIRWNIVANFTKEEK